MPTTLSGGEKQRVAIARCIVREPTVFLMDEPICSLDAKLREQTRIEMKKMLRKFKISTLYVTHDQQEAIFMGDRIAVMRLGKIEQLGTFDDLYYSPANLFVATFIGAPPMAILPARVQDGSLHLTHAGGEMAQPLRGDLAAAVPAGEVRFGVRPEGWVIEAGGDAGIPMQITHIERIPTEQASFLRGKIGTANVTVLAPLDYPETSQVTVSPDWEQVYFFAAEGEATLYTPGVPDLF